jgi:type VI secretion system secreted protein Hcp
MSVNIVLKLGPKPEIGGESVIDKHTGEIDCLSWSWGMTQTGSGHRGTGGGTGSADVQDLTIVKWVDAASPSLAAYCFNGTPLGDSILTCIKVGGGKPGAPNKVEFVKITMSGTVQISSTKSGEPEVIDGKTTDRFLETITLHFTVVNFDYTAQKADNSPGAVFPSNAIKIATT